MANLLEQEIYLRPLLGRRIAVLCPLCATNNAIWDALATNAPYPYYATYGSYYAPYQVVY